MDICNTTTCRLSTGCNCKKMLKKSNKIKFNKLLNFKLFLKRLTDSNLFPHKIKSNKSTNLNSSVNNLIEMPLKSSFINSKLNSSKSIDFNHQIKSTNSSKLNKLNNPLISHYKLFKQMIYKSSLNRPKSSYLISFNELILSAILFLLCFSANFINCDHINLPPRFITLPGYSSDIVLTIKEGNSSLNKEIYRLAGEDPNGDKLKFGVMGAIGSDILRIENDVPTNNQATIYLRKELDRETQPSYSLILTLTDGRLAKGSYITKSMFIIVEDINDNFPVFRPLKSSTIHLSEFAKPNTIIEQVEAFDQDEGRFGQVVYSIEEVDREPNANRTFTIETRGGKGVISLIGSLDYERKHLYQLRITASDLALEQDRKSTSTMLLVKIDDEPDQPPIFVFVPSVTRIQENLPIGTEIMHVKAVDGDREINNPIRYSITKGNVELFAINSTTGVINVAGELDREKAVRNGHGTNAYILEIQATELDLQNVGAEDLDWEPISNEQNSVKTEITIMLQDVNDEHPRFAASEYIGEIEENALPDTPIRFRDISNTNQDQTNWLTQTFNRVYDYDQGSNGTFTLRLIGDGASNFEISPTEVINEASFIIKVKDSKSLDYEMVKKFQFEILATETMPSYESDLQNNFYKKEIYNTANSQFTSDENNIYSTRVRVTILIIDKNDNFPQFNKETLGIINDHQRSCFQVNEFHQEGSLITRISATDNDEPASVNGKIKFQIVNDDSNLFDIVNDGQSMLHEHQFNPLNNNDNNHVNHFLSNKHYAKLITKHSLRDRIGNYTLTLKAQDYGHPSRETTETISICIYDINDHAPVFKSPIANQTLKIPENTTIDTVIMQIEATDSDHGLNAVVNYRLVELSNNHWKSFNLDSKTGKLRLKQPLNRQKLRNYHLLIEAYDLGQPNSLSTKQDLNILVTRISDPKPKFPQSELYLTFTENVPAGNEQHKIVQTVAKYDEEEDERLFSKQLPCYYIVGGDYKERFHLNIFTHNLSSKVLLDREERDNYTLIISASNDCMHEPNQVALYDPNDRSQLLVKIKILDKNDNKPKFIKNVFTGGVTTESSFGTVFMNVKAIDIDEGINSKIKYSIIGSPQSNDAEFLETIKNEPFALNPDNGEISLNFDPQRNMKGYFEFEVMANDTDNLQDTAKVKIYLLREDQRVLFVLRLTPSEIRERLEKFRDVLSNITGAIVNVDNYKFHTNEDGSVDKLKTDLYLHFVNPNDNTIMESKYILTLIDKNIDYLDELYKDFNVLLSKPTSELTIYTLSFDDQLKLILFACNAFFVLLLILVISLCFNQKNRYERKLKAATTSAYSIHPQLAVSNISNLPGQNQFAENQNPIWLNRGYDNGGWYKDEELSQNSNDHNSLDENMVTDQINNYSNDDLNDSFNGSSSNVTESNSTNNETQILTQCNNNLNNLKNINSNLIKSNGVKHQFNNQTIQSHNNFKPNKTVTNNLSCNCSPNNYLEHSEITCNKNRGNSILITTNNNSQYLNNMHLVNNLNIMNLETTEL